MPDRGSQSASRAAAILLALSEERRPRSLTQIAGDLGMAKSSTLGVLVSLEASGLVRRDDAGYTLGPGVMQLAGGFQQSFDVVAEFHLAVADSPLLSQEMCQLAVLSGSEALYLARRTGKPPLGFSAAPGDRFPASITAVGTALLAAMPDEEVTALYPDPDDLPLWTGRSTRSLPNLLTKLAEVRVRGYAIDDGETNPNVYGVAVRVRRVRTNATDLAVGASLRPIRGAAARADDVAAELFRVRERLEAPNAIA